MPLPGGKLPRKADLSDQQGAPMPYASQSTSGGRQNSKTRARLLCICSSRKPKCECALFCKKCSTSEAPQSRNPCLCLALLLSGPASLCSFIVCAAGISLMTSREWRPHLQVLFRPRSGFWTMQAHCTQTFSRRSRGTSPKCAIWRISLEVGRWSGRWQGMRGWAP